jgi:hypothetical protein
MEESLSDPKTSDQPAAPPVREGLALAVPEGQEDPGVYAVYPSLPADQWVKFKTVLTDDILDQANEAGNKTSTFSNTRYRTTLIKLMVLKCNVKDRTKDPAAENPYVDLRDDATLARLPSQFKLWLQGEIQRCDGSLAKVSTVVIGGVPCSFRAAA